jgi:RecA/RadA recombinase
VLTRRAPVPDASLASQVAARLTRGSRPAAAPLAENVISKGSTLLDLAISGGRYPEGGIPGGILVEIFGPSGAGKTVLLCEIAGAVQRQSGEVMFRDPEARLNNQFAALFGFKVENAIYGRPDTVPELFGPIRSWKPKSKAINAIFADSLAALSTDMEMEDKDKMGQRRAKEFSEECRKTCRVLTNRNFLMVCSNQIRQNVGATQFEQKFVVPGGNAIPFYADLRLRCHNPIKIPREIEIDGKKVKRIVGVKTTVEVFKSSIWEPHRDAPVHIIYSYGIDDIRANLEFVKSIVGGTHYMLSETERLDNGLERAIARVESNDGMDLQLRRYTIQLWRELEEKFKVSRREKRRG